MSSNDVLCFKLVRLGDVKPDSLFYSKDGFNLTPFLSGNLFDSENVCVYKLRELCALEKGLLNVNTLVYICCQNG